MTKRSKFIFDAIYDAYTVLATIIDTPKKSIFLHDNIMFSVRFLSYRKTKSISIDWKRI